MKPLRAGVFAIGLAGVLSTVVLIAGCGGGSDGGLLHPEDTAASPQTGAATTPQAGAKTATPAKATPVPPKATATPVPSVPLVADLAPVAVPLPSGYKAPLTGEPNAEAASVITKLLTANGVNLTGFGVLVLPVVATGDSILVLDVPESAVDTALPEDTNPLLAALATAPIVNEAKIVSLCLYVHGHDTDGAYVAIFVMPVSTLRQLAAGSTDEALSQTLKYEVVRQP